MGKHKVNGSRSRHLSSKMGLLSCDPRKGATGEVVIRKALRQSQMLPFFEKLCEAICEAVTRQTMQFVLIKSREQQAALALHSGQDREGRLSGF